MITFNITNFKFDDTFEYNKLIKEYDEYVERLMGKIACPFCHSHDVIKHSKYERCFMCDDNTFNMLIQRVKCKTCGRTHSIIPAHLVPYKRKSIYVIKEIIDEYESNKGMLSSDYSVVKTYKKWKNRIISLGKYINKIWDNYISLLRDCASAFSMCFMQSGRRKYCCNNELYEVIYTFS